jgi:hypothetical protein
MDKKVIILKNEIRKLISICRSYSINFKPAEMYNTEFFNTRLYKEIEYVYLINMVNGIYKVAKPNRQAITINTILEEHKDQLGNDLYEFLNIRISKMENEHKSLFEKRSKTLAHLDYEYIKNGYNAKFDIQELTRVITTIWEVMSQFLIECYDDTSLCNVEIESESYLTKLIYK